MVKATLRTVDDHGNVYQALMFVCPGCASTGSSGIHMLAVNSPTKAPQWTWDGNLDAPTLSPSILSRGAPFENGKPLGVCHSFLEAGVFRFLDDCTHELKGQTAPMGELPTWATDENPEGTEP